MHGRYERQKPKKKGGKIALIVVCVLVVLIGAGGFAGWAYYNSMLNKINRAELIEKEPDQELLNEIGAIITDPPTEATETVPETTAPVETEPTEPPAMKPEDIINILMIGQAAREGEDYKMADSTMLITVNKYTKTVTLSSVLRDTYVKYPAYRGKGGGKCKFTSAYANAYAMWDTLGAMEVMNLLMEQNFGVEVDYNFEVNFDAVINCIDAMGGIDVELNEAETKYLNKELVKCGYPELEPGLNGLDGFSALTYARMRKAEGDGESDIKRTARQRHLVEQLIRKVGYILATEGLSAVQELANTVLPYVTTNMDNSEITRLMFEILPIIPELKVEKGSIPIETTYWGELRDIYNIGREDSILLFDEGQNKRLIRAITEGEGVN